MDRPFFNLHYADLTQELLQHIQQNKLAYAKTFLFLAPLLLQH